MSPDEENVEIFVGEPAVNQLAEAVLQTMATVPTFEPATVTYDGKRYTVVALLGQDTQDLAASYLTEADLVVPLSDEQAVSLVRHYHSFFEPGGVLGLAWTLNLPTLVQRSIPTSSSSSERKYRIIRQVLTPLNSYGQYFDSVYRGNDQRIGFPTEKLILPDGQHWHFNDAGQLVAAVDVAVTIIYRRDEEGRIMRIEGWHGKYQGGHIQLTYNDQGQIVQAEGSDEQVVTYAYTPSNLLTTVTTRTDTLSYAYQNRLVIAIYLNGNMVRQFEYGNRGQLLREKAAGEPWIAYTLETNAGSIAMTASATDAVATSATITYDTAYRPLSRSFEDGSQLQWDYGAEETKATLTLPTGSQYVLTQSVESKHRTLHLPEGGVLAAAYDSLGRLLEVRQGEQSVLRQTWNPDGRLGLVAFETVAFRPEYDPYGVMKRMWITEPTQAKRLSEWLEIQYDDQGRIHQLRDYTGADMRMAYDDQGRLTEWVSGNPGALTITYGANQTEINTTWGYTQSNTYDAGSGMLQQVAYGWSGQTNMVQFERGHPTYIQQYDGGVYNFFYHQTGVQDGKLASVKTPNNVSLQYRYDHTGRLSSVRLPGYTLNYTYAGTSTGGNGCPIACSASSN